MIRLSEQQFETLKRRENPEVFTENQISSWVTNYADLITKSTTDELDESEKALINEFDNEFKSFTRIQVISNPKPGELQKSLKYDEFYIREQQIIWDDPIVKSIDGKEVTEQAKTGIFANTDHNRKLNRVGQRFGELVSVEGNGLGVEKGSEDELEKAEGDKGGHVIGHTKSGKPVYSHKNANDYSDFSKEDHSDAAELHEKQRDFHRPHSTQESSHWARKNQHMDASKEK